MRIIKCTIFLQYFLETVSVYFLSAAKPSGCRKQRGLLETKFGIFGYPSRTKLFTQVVGAAHTSKSRLDAVSLNSRFFAFFADLLHLPGNVRGVGLFLRLPRDGAGAGGRRGRPGPGRGLARVLLFFLPDHGRPVGAGGVRAAPLRHLALRRGGRRARRQRAGQAGAQEVRNERPQCRPQQKKCPANVIFFWGVLCYNFDKQGGTNRGSGFAYLEGLYER